MRGEPFTPTILEPVDDVICHSPCVSGPKVAYGSKEIFQRSLAQTLSAISTLQEPVPACVSADEADQACLPPLLQQLRQRLDGFAYVKPELLDEL
jgi:hypothetical protein